MLIRAVRPADAQALADLANLPGYRFGTLRIPYTSAETTRTWIETSGAATLSLVVERDGQVIAHGGLRRFDGRRAHAASLGMGVHDDHVGQGVGTALLTAILDSADRWLMIRRIELTVWTENTRAIALYSRFGFEEEGRFKDYAFRDGAFVDSLAMARIRAF